MVAIKPFQRPENIHRELRGKSNLERAVITGEIMNIDFHCQLEKFLFVLMEVQPMINCEVELPTPLLLDGIDDVADSIVATSIVCVFE